MTKTLTFSTLTDMVVDAILANPDWFRQMTASQGVMLLNPGYLADSERVLPYLSFGRALVNTTSLIERHLKDTLTFKKVTYTGFIANDRLEVVVRVDGTPFHFSLYGMSANQPAAGVAP